MPTEIINTASFSTSLPRPIKGEIQRDNIITAISDAISSGFSLIFLDAPEGYGKTVALGQFVRKFPDNTISLFINPATRYSYSLDYLIAELCIQINWVLNENVLKDDDRLNQSMLNSLFARLARRCAREKENITIILDGMSDIPETDNEFQNKVFGLFPIGAQYISVLISRSNNTNFGNLPRTESKELSLPPLSRAEVKEFFDSYSKDESIITDIYAATMGKPIYLASIMRLAQRGESLSKLIDNLPKQLRDIYALEWRNIDENDGKLMDVLTAITLKSVNGNISKLAKVFSIIENELEHKLSLISFLTIRDENNCQYVCEPYRKFAEGKLANRIRSVENMVIAYLMREPDAPDALGELPEFFQKSNRPDDLFAYLTIDRLKKAVEIAQSVYPVQQTTEMAVKVALKEGKEEQLVNFSLLKSTLNEVKKADALKIELEAELAFENIEQACRIAESCPLREDRLELLSALGEKLQDDGKQIPDTVLSQLKAIVTQIDPNTLGDKLMLISASLASCDLKLAIDFLKRTRRNDATGSVLDQAFARVSLARGDSKAENDESRELRKTAIEGIQNDGLKNIAKAFQGSMAFLDETELVLHLETVSDPADRLYILRQWLLANRKHAKALMMADFALGLMIKTTSIAPNAKIIREIATPLPYGNDPILMQALVKRIDAQRTTIDQLGPSEEIIRLNGLLARAESLYSGDNCYQRLNAMREFSIGQIDYGVRVACIGQLFYTLHQIRLNCEERFNNLKEEVSVSLDSELETLLAVTADQFTCLRSALRVLAIIDLRRAISIASKLNTEDRRNSAYTEILVAISENQSFNISGCDLESILEKITDKSARETAFASFIFDWTRALALKKTDANIDHRILDNALVVDDPEEACRLLSACAQIIQLHDDIKIKNRTHEILLRLDKMLGLISADWDKANTGFLLARDLAKVDKTIAQRYLNQAHDLRSSTTVESSAHARTIDACLEMSVRAFGALAYRKQHEKKDLDDLLSLINSIPSKFFQVSALSDLITRIYFAGDLSLAREVTKSYLSPFINIVPQNYDDQTIYIQAAPALYIYHPETCHLKLLQLSDELREMAYVEIITALFRKRSPFETYDKEIREGFDLSYEEILDIIKIIEKFDADTRINSYIERVVHTTITQEKRKLISRAQKSEIAQLLTQIANRKLPDKNNIKHDGFLIITLASIALLDKRENEKFWNELITRGNAIPNIADRCYVIAVLASAVPIEHKRRLLFESALHLVESIPLDIDRINRYELLADQVYPHDQSLARKCMESALKEANNCVSSEASDFQRNVINHAYQLDENLGADLASKLDADPARSKYKSTAKEIQINQMHKKLMHNSDSDWSEVADEDPELIADACAKLLAKVNAGKHLGIPHKKLNQYIAIASTMPICSAKPIISLVIETICLRNSSNRAADSSLRSIYSAAIRSSRLAFWFVKKTESRFRDHQQTMSGSTSCDTIVEPNTRQQSIELIMNWMKHRSKDYLWVCDPYFTEAELFVFEKIVLTIPDISIIIFSSIKCIKEKDAESRRARFINAWRQINVTGNPDILVILHECMDNGEPIIHDRWWLTSGSGLNIGSSINQLGMHKISQIQELTEEDALVRENVMQGYITKRNKVFEGRRVRYESFSL